MIVSQATATSPGVTSVSQALQDDDRQLHVADGPSIGDKSDKTARSSSSDTKAGGHNEAEAKAAGGGLSPAGTVGHFMIFCSCMKYMYTQHVDVCTIYTFE